MSRLTVQNAQITTASVEVKTLTISGKQVTLAVFRQLQQEDLITDDGLLNGVPWGRVNYCPAGECSAESSTRQHLHMVWQKGDQLRRSKVREPAWRSATMYSEESDDFVQALYCLNEHKLPNGCREVRDHGDRCVAVELDDVEVVTAMLPDWPGSSRAARMGKPHECSTRDQLHEAHKWVLKDVAREKELRVRVSAHWAAFGDLPQLFIAV